MRCSDISNSDPSTLNGDAETTKTADARTVGSSQTTEQQAHNERRRSEGERKLTHKDQVKHGRGYLRLGPWLRQLRDVGEPVVA